MTFTFSLSVILLSPLRTLIKVSTSCLTWLLEPKTSMSDNESLKVTIVNDDVDEQIMQLDEALDKLPDAFAGLELEAGEILNRK